MTIDQITSGPTGPSRARPDDFAGEAAEYVTWKINTNVPETQTVITQMNASTAQVAINTLSTEAYKNQAISATDAYGWSSGGSSRAFAVEETLVFSDGHSYRCVTATTAGQSPITHPAKWQQITATPRTIKTEARTTTGTPITVFDRGVFFELSGTFTQTFDNVADIEEGWFCFLKNAGTGKITLDPYGSELIDGLSSYIMYPGECRLCRSTGTAFETTVLNPFSTTFTVSSTFYKPPGYKNFGGLITGSGNGGGKGTYGYGGGGGGSFPFTIQEDLVSATETITIGSGGAARTTDGYGNPGTDTSFGSLFIIYNITSSGKPNFGGNPVSSYYLTDCGAYGYNGLIYGGGSGDISNDGGASSMYGGGGGGDKSGSSGGVSDFAGNGGDGSETGNGSDGAVPGGGGGGTDTGTSSGAGARGELKLWGI